MNKTLHYCWFGGSPIPDNLKIYMESWIKFCPDFTIKRWDENNFDVNSVPFVAEAYAAKKWAFVSDYVRTYALWSEGGLYVDTDVEFIKPIDDLCSSSFIGFESKDNVNPGLILFASNPHEKFYEEVLNYYNKLHFDIEHCNLISSPKIYTEILEEFGLKRDNTLQKLGEITVYPMEYFQPWGENWKRKSITENTRTIHHYDASWLSKTDKQYYRFRKTYGEIWGRIFFTIIHPIEAFKKLVK